MFDLYIVSSVWKALLVEKNYYMSGVWNKYYKAIAGSSWIFYDQHLVRFIMNTRFYVPCLLSYLHTSSSFTVMIRTFGLMSFPISIGVLNNFLKSLCHFSVCVSKFTTKAMNPKIVTKIVVIRMFHYFLFT